MNQSYHFDERLKFSQGRREENDIQTLYNLIPGSMSIVKTNLQEDKSGIDYTAMLRRGAVLNIDAKARDKGCSKFWQNGPEAALEIWSVMPEGKYNISEERSRTGWTLCEKRNTDLILFTFDKVDFYNVFLVSFPLLRIVFKNNFVSWDKICKKAIQDSHEWESQCMFVPIRWVKKALNDLSFPGIDNKNVTDQAQDNFNTKNVESKTKESTIILRIEAPHFTKEVGLEKTDVWRVKEAPDIIAYMKNWPENKLKSHIEINKWSYQKL